MAFSQQALLGEGYSVVPGSSTITTTGAGNFTVPSYNTLTIELWGPGGGGDGMPSGSSPVAVAGNTGPSTTISSLSLVAGGGQGGQVAAGGAGGTASGGTTNTSGSAGVVGGAPGGSYGQGGAGANGGAAVAAPSGAASANGNAGNAPGGGGSSAYSVFNVTGTEGSGAGGGSYCSTSYTHGAAGAPLVGASLAYVVGAGGTGGSSTFIGGPGAGGRIKFTWS